MSNLYSRATFINPAFFCSFNSLTQCLYNIRPFRDLLLECDFSIVEQKPFVFFDPAIINDMTSKLPEKLENQITFSKASFKFSIEYKEIFLKMSDPTNRLDLANCVSNLVDIIGKPILLQRPTDPFLEYLSIISLLSNTDKPFYLNQLQPRANKFVQLFSFFVSQNFKDPEVRLFLNLSSTSSIFSVQLSGFFYNFKIPKSENRSNSIILHSLPDVLAMRYDYNESIQPKGDLQKTIDFTEYVFENKTKSNIFRLNSFVMMLSNQHAVAYVRVMETADTDREKWLICNDIQQKTIGLDELGRDLQFYGKNKCAIIGFYERSNV